MWMNKSIGKPFGFYFCKLTSKQTCLYPVTLKTKQGCPQMRNVGNLPILWFLFQKDRFILLYIS